MGGLGGRARRLAAAACVVGGLMVGTAGAQSGSRPEPRRDDPHNHDGCLERLSVSRHSTRRHRANSLARRRFERGAQVGRRDLSKHHGGCRNVEQPSHRRHGNGRSERQAVVRVRLLHIGWARVRRRGDVRRGLHGLHESEQRVRDREGVFREGRCQGAWRMAVCARSVRAGGAGRRRRGGGAVPGDRGRAQSDNGWGCRRGSR